MNNNGNGFVVFLFSGGRPPSSYLQDSMCMSTVGRGWSCLADSKTACSSNGCLVSGMARLSLSASLMSARPGSPVTCLVLKTNPSVPGNLVGWSPCSSFLGKACSFRVCGCCHCFILDSTQAILACLTSAGLQRGGLSLGKGWGPCRTLSSPPVAVALLSPFSPFGQISSKRVTHGAFN